MNRIQDAPDDVVIQICRHLSVRDILAFRQTCKHAFAVSCLKILWVSLCTTHVTSPGIPFPDTARVNQMSAQELEIATREALDRDRRLRCEPPPDGPGYTPKARVYWQANRNSPISEILFVPDPSGHEGRCIVTVSKGIWCLISLWDTQAIGREPEITSKPKMVGWWGPKGAIFTAIAVNSDCRSEASAAVAVNLYEKHPVYILSFFDNAAGEYAPRVHVLRTWDPSLPVCNSVSLCRNILAAADSLNCAAVVNVDSSEDKTVVLESTTISSHPQMSNICLQIQISQNYVLIARAKFVEVFDLPKDIFGTETTLPPSNAKFTVETVPEPNLRHPVDSFSFGWVDNISISRDITKPDSFFVLFPQPNDDPWSTHAPTLTFYRLEVNSTTDGEKVTPPPDTPDPPAHIFSETFLASLPLAPSMSPTSTSSSTSTKLVVGRYHTALWLSPRPREWDTTGLVQMDLNRQGDWPFQARGMRTWRNSLGDDLVWASFGPKRTKPETQKAHFDEGLVDTTEEEDSMAPIFTNRILNSRGEDWTAIGYDEETGRVALGRRDGYVTFLRL